MREFRAIPKFRSDSTYCDIKRINTKDDDRKWILKKGVVEIKYNLPKNNFDEKPVLYGQLMVIICCDSLVVLKRSIVKNKWERIFFLEKYN